MINPPIEPHNGDDLSATWLRSLLRYVRATRPIAGPGLKHRVTPNGTHLYCDLPRGGGGGKAPDLSCFRIAGLKYTESSGTISAVEVKLANLFYRIDGKTYELEVPESGGADSGLGEGDSGLGEEEPETLDPEPGTLTITSNSDEFVIAIRCEVTDGSEVPSAELVTLQSIAQLQTQERNRNYYHDPIWLFRDFAPAVDLRTAPRMIMTEF